MVSVERYWNKNRGLILGAALLLASLGYMYNAQPGMGGPSPLATAPRHGQPPPPRLPPSPAAQPSPASPAPAVAPVPAAAKTKTKTKAAGKCLSSNRNVVLGAAFTYDVATLRPFMRSLARTGGGIDGVLFITGQAEAALAKEAHEYGFRFFAEGVDYENDGVLRRHGFPSFDMKRKEIFRFLLYDEFLHRYEGCYDKVVIADTRDLYFQRDPFVFVEQGLYVCQEEVREHDPKCCELGENGGFNGRWNRGSIDCAKTNGAKQIIRDYTKHEQTPIVCSGVSLGTTAAMQTYLLAMIDYFKTQMTKTCEGLDQGVHQVLLYTGKIPGKVTFWTNEQGPVFNMGSPCNHGQPQRDLPNYNPMSPPPLPSAAHKADALFELQNGARTMVAAIVHQYDRCVYLRMKLHGHYVNESKQQQ